MIATIQYLRLFFPFALAVCSCASGMATPVLSPPLTDYAVSIQRVDTTYLDVCTSADPCIQAAKMNVLFIGVQNPIVVRGELSDDFEVVVEDTRHKLTPAPDNSRVYYLEVFAPGEVNISIRQPDGKVSYTQSFRAKRIPAPVANIPGLSSEKALVQPPINRTITDLC